MTGIYPWGNKTQLDEQSVEGILRLNVPDIEVGTIWLFGIIRRQNH